MQTNLSHNNLARFLAMLVLATCISPVLAQRGLKNIPSTDPHDELKSFTVAEGFKVELFASEPMIAKPIQMNFDAQGRLWVASSSIYPMIKPGQVANDKIVILEDTNGDGKADKHTVFADNLLVPTAVVHDNLKGNGCYVANSTELLHLTDTDGDGKADKRRVMLSGFGSEDTHHILHTFRWGIDGMLYMNQSIYIHSHIETPYGVRRMRGGGIWHFHPKTMRLETFELGHVNTWGHQQDRWGQSFATDGAYNQGINYTFPGAVFATSPGAKRILKGLNQGQPKHCGLEILSGRHLPEEYRGTMIANDFRGNRINRFVIKENASGYQSIKTNDLLTSKHQAFRPIDVKMGPDGAIYVADWYNPIIQHGEVDFRDDRRDRTHGRIWRISAIDRPTVKPPKLVGATTEQLLAALKSPEDYTRLHAKLQLKSRKADEVAAKIAAWVQGLDKNSPDYEHHRLEALWAYQNIDRTSAKLLSELLASKDHRVRAAATRVLYHWRNRTPGQLQQLPSLVRDANPRVRLEALHVLRQSKSVEAASIAMTVLEQPLDRFLDFSAWQTARELAPHWLEALKQGKTVFNGDAKQLAFALQSYGGRDALKPLIAMIQSNKLPAAEAHNLRKLIIQQGNNNALVTFFKTAASSKTPPAQQAELLNAIAQRTRQTNSKLNVDAKQVAELVNSQNISVKSAAIRLAGQWKTETLRDIITTHAKAPNANAQIQQAALDSLALLGGPKSKAALIAMTAKGQPRPKQMSAAVALASIDVNAGAEKIADIISQLPAGSNPRGMVQPLLNTKAGPAALAKALQSRKIDTDTAKITLRIVQGSGRQSAALVKVLLEKAGITNPKRELSPTEMASLVSAVQKQGSPVRGELIFRRSNLKCLACHAIGGAGGTVGPDMTSLGGSAPVDYVIESLINPKAKVKEGYHAKQIFTKDNEVLIGVFVRKTDSEIILRTAEDKVISVPLSSIDLEKDAPSLMPPGLTDALTRAEMIDLVAFLSKLGKEGDYKVSSARFIRTWRTPIPTRQSGDFYRHGGIAAFPKSHEQVQWSPVYSNVNGALPWSETTKVWVNGPRYALARATISVTTAGKIALRVNHTEGTELWLNDKRITVSATTTIDVPKGTHTLTFALLEGKNAPAFSAELIEVKSSKARAVIVNGK